ncbi:hypothetical protein VLY81_01960 [Geochorda subterranea]|uniref:Uncharacterized protein n=1 Tax=Geochorda subterranea TaxID=3109564 RepID=A0ABZ1BQU8_9FIRM|nr:hypothetical protein [Limnochorda sp. LNt]WRP14961.1 hypothetical protein VLY81_01960 [Limnochorda sp. LNt]
MSVPASASRAKASFEKYPPGSSPGRLGHDEGPLLGLAPGALDVEVRLIAQHLRGAVAVPLLVVQHRLQPRVVRCVGGRHRDGGDQPVALAARHQMGFVAVCPVRGRLVAMAHLGVDHRDDPVLGHPLLEADRPVRVPLDVLGGHPLQQVHHGLQVLGHLRKRPRRRHQGRRVVDQRLEQLSAGLGVVPVDPGLARLVVIGALQYRRKRTVQLVHPGHRQDPHDTLADEGVGVLHGGPAVDEKGIDDLGALRRKQPRLLGRGQGPLQHGRRDAMLQEAPAVVAQRHRIDALKVPPAKIASFTRSSKRDSCSISRSE